LHAYEIVLRCCFVFGEKTAGLLCLFCNGSMVQENKYLQLCKEANDWYSKLDILNDENIQLKKRLGYRLSENVRGAILMKADALQHRLLNKDSAIRFLRKEIIEYARDLATQPQDMYADNLVLVRHLKMQSDIEELAKQINILKVNFDSYFED
jgi:hypothetical protein